MGGSNFSALTWLPHQRCWLGLEHLPDTIMVDMYKGKGRETAIGSMCVLLEESDTNPPLAVRHLQRSKLVPVPGGQIPAVES